MADNDAELPRKIMYFRRDDGAVLYGWVIQYEGVLWLVPQWDVGPSAGTLRPTRIISLSGLPVGSPSPRRSDNALVLSTPLSKHVLEGRREVQDPLAEEHPPIVVKKSEILGS
jgi:hypothetical protein